MPKKSKKQKREEEEEEVPEPVQEKEEEEEEEEEDGEEEEEDENGNDTEQEENEEEEEEEAPDGESDETRVKRLKAQRRNNRRNARQVGYRKWAKQAGLGMSHTSSFGNDVVKSVFSTSDIMRMATWCPHTADAGISLPEFKGLLAMRDESISSGPLQVLQANVESFARKVVGEVVLRSMEAQGPMTINAANVRSVLRPFNNVLRSEFSTPMGLVRAAQHAEKNEETILPRSAEEDTAIADERKFCKSNHAKEMREADRARDLAIAERKKRKAEASSAGNPSKKKKKKKTDDAASSSANESMAQQPEVSATASA